MRCSTYIISEERTTDRGSAASLPTGVRDDFPLEHTISLCSLRKLVPEVGPQGIAFWKTASGSGHGYRIHNATEATSAAVATPRTAEAAMPRPSGDSGRNAVATIPARAIAVAANSRSRRARGPAIPMTL